MTQKELNKRIAEKHSETMTINEVLSFIEKEIAEAKENLDGGDYAYGCLQALKEIYSKLYWDGIDLS